MHRRHNLSVHLLCSQSFSELVSHGLVPNDSYVSHKSDSSSQSFFNDNRASPTPCHRPRQYTSRTSERFSTEDKLQEMVNTLGRLNWPFWDFVHAWAGAEGRARDVKVNNRNYRISKWWKQHWVTAATAL